MAASYLQSARVHEVAWPPWSKDGDVAVPLVVVSGAREVVDHMLQLSSNDPAKYFKFAFYDDSRNGCAAGIVSMIHGQDHLMKADDASGIEAIRANGCKIPAHNEKMRVAIVDSDNLIEPVYMDLYRDESEWVQEYCRCLIQERQDNS